MAKISFPGILTVKNLALELKAKYPGQIKFSVSWDPWTEYVHTYPTFWVENPTKIEQQDLDKIKALGCIEQKYFPYNPYNTETIYRLDIKSWRPELYPTWFDSTLIWIGQGYEVTGIEALRKYCEDCYAPERKSLGLE